MRFVLNFFLACLWGTIALGCFQSFKKGDDSDVGLGGSRNTSETGSPGVVYEPSAGGGVIANRTGGSGGSVIRRIDGGYVEGGRGGAGGFSFAGFGGGGGIGGIAGIDGGGGGISGSSGSVGSGGVTGTGSSSGSSGYDSGGSSGIGGLGGDSGIGGGGSGGWGGSGSSGTGGDGGSAGTGGFGGDGGTDGGENECESDSDCDDFDLCTTETCVLGACRYLSRDQDDDGYTDIVCGGEDCNDLNAHVHPDQVEACTDGADNDCNGVSDCFDPACEHDPGCGCIPSPLGENCSNTVDDDCDTTVDCLDADCVGTVACGCTTDEIGLCGDGIDNDCDDTSDCGDDDCVSEPSCSCQGRSENCANGNDDDCDLLVDCADPDCAGRQPCACRPPGVAENCSDGRDNDCDTYVDCADPDCLTSFACRDCTAEICNDGLDNNCNDRIDCADVACYFASTCALIPEICNNSLDDDHDFLIDCQDPDCANNPYCVLKQANCLSPKLIPESGSYFGDTTGNIGENRGSCGGGAGEAVFYFVLTESSRVHLDSIGTSFDSMLYVRAGACDDGVEIGCDDDSAGNRWAAALDFTILYPGVYFVFLDGFTVNNFDQGPFQLNVEIEPNPDENCSDSIDNDGDLLVDCADTECIDADSCIACNNGIAPVAEFGVAACTDGEDNDCDGLFDCDDDDCSASDYYVTECCDGRDGNGNGIVDEFNCRCVNDADCQGSQICYTHTTHTCGPPCMRFNGHVCPFIAPGSYCNTQTRQCEF